ncbi:hypothetical protein Tco_1134582 [Tanacetum coccineum]
METLTILREQREPIFLVPGLRDLELYEDGIDCYVMWKEHRDYAGVLIFTSQLGGAVLITRPLGPLGAHFGVYARERLHPEAFSRTGIYIPGKRWIPYFARDFLGPPPSYTLIRDPMLRLCHRMMAHSIAGRSQAPEKVTVTDLFYLRAGMWISSPQPLPYYLRYLRGCRFVMQLDDTWAWVPKDQRQPEVAAKHSYDAMGDPTMHSMDFSEGAHMQQFQDAPAKDCEPLPISATQQPSAPDPFDPSYPYLCFKSYL